MFFAASIALLFLAMLVFSIWLECGNQVTFNDRWPAISDDEFVAKCTPGTNPETALKVRRIVAEQLGVPYDRIHPDQSFVDDLDCC